MESLGDWFIAFISEQDSLTGLGVLAGAALVEYVFPPFPGDTITLFGAVLITSQGWSAPLVLAAVLTGALIGTSLAWRFGRRLGKRASLPARWQGRLERIVARFDRHGAAYLFIARFLPGMRAPSCVAAGMSGMPLTRVLLWSGSASLVYNVALIASGSLLGANVEELAAIVSHTTTIAWLGLGVAALLALGLWIWRRRRGPRSADPAEPSEP